MSARYEKIRQNAKKMLLAFLEHWEHPGQPSKGGPAAYGLVGGVLARIAELKANRTEIQASLRFMVDKGWIERTQTPDWWFEDILPDLIKIARKDVTVRELTGNSSYPDTWWYILTQSGIAYARWLKLPKWRRRFITVRDFLRCHLKKIILGIIISLIAAAIWAVVRGYLPLE